MTSHQTNAAEDTLLSDEDVARFLKGDEEFFLRHPDLLAGLQLPHESGNGAVSLVERQLSVLRDKNRSLEVKLKELISAARSNHDLSGKVHALALKLIRAEGTTTVIEVVEQALREEFGASDAVVVLFHNPSDIVQVDDTRFLRRVDRQDAGIKPFATFIEQGRPRCGRARDAQLEFLFPDHSLGIGSMALIPLGHKAEIGMMAIGSQDAERFHPGMSTDFLERIGDLVSYALAARGD